MTKRKALTAPEVAYLMGFEPSADKDVHYGRKALVGQYTKRYTRAGHLPATGRISKGAQRRYDRDNGTEGVLDYSAVINARR